MTEPSELLCTVFEQVAEEYGDPDMLYDFKQAPEGVEWSAPLDVFVWRPTEGCPLATFMTIGMSDVEQANCDHRCELRLSVQANITEAMETEFAHFLAQMAQMPFQSQSCFDLWQTLGPYSSIPLFDHCKYVVLHPEFVDEGFDRVIYQTNFIKLLNVMPITGEELALLQTKGEKAFREHFRVNRLSPFRDRSYGTT